MAGRLPNPFMHWVNSAGAPYAGGSLGFFASGTDTPLATYSDQSLTIPNANPLPLNAAGRPDTAIFLQNLPYKVVLKDSSGNEIWTADPVSATDFASVFITKVGSGSPSGVEAGTAGSSGVLPTMYWDYTNRVLYVAVVTGNAATTEWLALNAQAATPTVTTPQGYLTPTPGTAIITSDASASTSIGYESFVGNLVPIYNGSRMIPTEFSVSGLTLSLVSQHALSTIYDVFVFLNSGVPTLVTGPAWNNSGAGTGSRGTGAGTTQLTRLGGFWVNAVSMTARNGSTTYSVGANLATYVGSISIDGTAGQVTCHRAYGQSRKWGVWNAYNRQPLYLKAGDAAASWPYNIDTIRASNNNSANSLTVFSGLAEDIYDLEFVQRITTVSSSSAQGRNGIGWNSTTAMSGKQGSIDSNAAGGAAENGGDGVAQYQQVPSIGINTVTALENAADVASVSMTWYGAEANMLLSAKWRG